MTLMMLKNTTLSLTQKVWMILDSVDKTNLFTQQTTEINLDLMSSF